VRLILIRHGQTACNITDIWHGWDDCRLTELGVAQAEALAQRLAAEPMVAMYCSDLRRAVETAGIVAGPHGLTPVTDPAFRERKAGDFQGLSTEEVVRQRPSVWDERASDFWNWTPPNGESFTQMLERVMAGVDRIREAHPDDTVALVGHMGTVRVLTSKLLGIPMAKTYEMDFPSTGVTILRLDGDAVTVEVLNDAAHLTVGAGG